MMIMMMMIIGVVAAGSTCSVPLSAGSSWSQEQSGVGDTVDIPLRTLSWLDLVVVFLTYFDNKKTKTN